MKYFRWGTRKDRLNGILGEWMIFSEYVNKFKRNDCFWSPLKRENGWERMSGGGRWKGKRKNNKQNFSSFKMWNENVLRDEKKLRKNWEKIV